MWRKDGKELFFMTLDGKLMITDVRAGSMLETGAPHVLFQSPGSMFPVNFEYSVTGDGKRFIFREPAGDSRAPIAVVLNWDAGLKR